MGAGQSSLDNRKWRKRSGFLLVLVWKKHCPHHKGELWREDEKEDILLSGAFSTNCHTSLYFMCPLEFWFSFWARMVNKMKETDWIPKETSVDDWLSVNQITSDPLNKLQRKTQTLSALEFLKLPCFSQGWKLTLIIVAFCWVFTISWALCKLFTLQSCSVLTSTLRPRYFTGEFTTAGRLSMSLRRSRTVRKGHRADARAPGSLAGRVPSPALLSHGFWRRNS